MTKEEALATVPRYNVIVDLVSRSDSFSRFFEHKDFAVDFIKNVRHDGGIWKNGNTFYPYHMIAKFEIIERY